MLGGTFGIVQQGGDNDLIKLRKQKLEFSESEEARNNKAEFHRRGKELGRQKAKEVYIGFSPFLLELRLC